MAKKQIEIAGAGSVSVQKLVLTEFPGMSVVPAGGSAKVPYFVYNMDVTYDAKLRARKKLVKVASVSDPTSLFSYKGKVFFIASDVNGRALYCFYPNGNAVQKIFDLPYPAKRIYYAPVDDFIYFGCKRFIYKLTLPALLVGEFSDLNVDKSRVLFDGLEDRHVSELIPMTPCDYLCMHQSRLVGSVGRKVVFSEPFLYEFTRMFNYLQFGDEVTGIFSVGNILYVGTRYATYIVAGTLEAPEIKEVGIGCMRNSMGVATIALGNAGRVKVPIWVASTAIVIGLPDGNIVPITEGKLDFKYDMDSEAGGVGGNYDVTYVSSPPDDMRSSASAKFVLEIVRNGKVIYREG